MLSGGCANRFFQRGASEVFANLGGLRASIFHGTDGCEILRMLRDANQFIGADPGRQSNLLLLPEPVQMFAPCLAQPRKKEVGTAEQKSPRFEHVAAGQYAEVLEHDGVKERSHQLFRRNALLLQAGNVGLGKDAAFAGHRMQLDSVVANRPPVVRRISSTWRQSAR